MKEWTTPKGTKLPIIDLRGKDYLQAAHRLVWFREEHPDWSIQTEFIKLEEKYAIARATIRNLDMIMATAHKREDEKDFKDFAEKAETSAVARALAFCGYGTQFCGDELEEGQRLADAPNKRATKQKPLPEQDTNDIADDPGKYIVRCGRKLRGMTLESIPVEEISGFMRWIQTDKQSESVRNQDEYQEFLVVANDYLSRPRAR